MRFLPYIAVLILVGLALWFALGHPLNSAG
jgi:hypothetical protein